MPYVVSYFSHNSTIIITIGYKWWSPLIQTAYTSSHELSHLVIVDTGIAIQPFTKTHHTMHLSSSLVPHTPSVFVPGPSDSAGFYPMLESSSLRLTSSDHSNTNMELLQALYMLIHTLLGLYRKGLGHTALH